MMTQSLAFPQTKLPTRCGNCPYFADHEDNRGKGWCNLFDRVCFRHHLFRPDCQHKEVSPEDRIHLEFNRGDRVSLIDSRLHHSQWLSFVVVGSKYDFGWLFLLATIEKPTISLIWVSENEICHQEQSYNINPMGEF